MLDWVPETEAKDRKPKTESAQKTQNQKQNPPKARSGVALGSSDVRGEWWGGGGVRSLDLAPDFRSARHRGRPLLGCLRWSYRGSGSPTRMTG